MNGVHCGNHVNALRDQEIASPARKCSCLPVRRSPPADRAAAFGEHSLSASIVKHSILRSRLFVTAPVCHRARLPSRPFAAESLPVPTSFRTLDSQALRINLGPVTQSDHDRNKNVGFRRSWRRVCRGDTTSAEVVLLSCLLVTCHP